MTESIESDPLKKAKHVWRTMKDDMRQGRAWKNPRNAPWAMKAKNDLRRFRKNVLPRPRKGLQWYYDAGSFEKDWVLRKDRKDGSVYLKPPPNRKSAVKRQIEYFRKHGRNW